ncbi:MAG: UBP-type zinc finger domain-containing protein [Acidobacteria bacterium]|nr:UBP-type zinc finger domain-containing protein [Acidobacteriota bacterium]
MPAECTHLEQATEVEPNAKGCEECLATGGRWVHLRLCLACGHVGCCDSSPGKHATKHFRQTDHPVVESFEPGESWRWCYVDQLFAE